jgi:hypothetical protein
MKNVLLAIVFSCLLSLPLCAQYDVWDFQGYSIGADVAGAGNCQMGAMPDVILIGNTYYMYYIARYNNVNAIYYATSPDMISWDVQDTVMCASSDTTNRIYDIGGPGVMKLNTGQYRLFYRTSQKVSPPNEPLFHIRSMISNDGIHFTHEGVRVEIQTYNPTSYFKSASHPSMYKDAFGNTRAIITGRDTSMNINSPAGLYTATSPDEGLTWTNFTPLYPKCHDPIVVKDSLNVYHLYTSYLGTGHVDAVSPDGISWTRDSILIMQGSTVLNEQTSSSIIADLGAAVLPTGNIVLYSNYKPNAPGPWVDIAYYFLSPTSGMEEENAGESGLLYPNPSNRFINVTDPQRYSACEIFNLNGQLIASQDIASDGTIDVGELVAGMYFVHLISADGISIERIIKN